MQPVFVPYDYGIDGSIPHGLEKALDNLLLELAKDAVEYKTPVELQLPIRNANRTVGTILGSEITRRYGFDGLPDDSPRSLAIACGLGAASSSCSYAAVALALQVLAIAFSLVALGRRFESFRGRSYIIANAMGND